MFLIGQENNKELIDSGKLDNSNFIIIKGPSDCGKTYLAKYIADHYNMDYVKLDNKVSTVRDLVDSSKYNNNCIYHFEDFEKSSVAAKAALLKIAEETPEGIKIIVTTQASNILQTLTSRAYVLSIEPYTEEQLSEYASTLNFNIQLLERLQKLNMLITPSLLFNYKQREDIEEIIDLAEETFIKLEKGLTLEDISLISSKFWKDDLERLSIYLNLLAIMCLGLSHDRFVNTCFIQEALYNLNKVSINNYKILVHNLLMEMV